jgi:hypothetical protein
MWSCGADISELTGFGLLKFVALDMDKIRLS